MTQGPFLDSSGWYQISPFLGAGLTSGEANLIPSNTKRCNYFAEEKKKESQVLNDTKINPKANSLKCCKQHY